MEKAELKDRHARVFGVRPELCALAPGRVNLIGEHTDYNEGFVMPIAIERRVLASASRRADRVLDLYSADFDQRVTVALDDLTPRPGHWSSYPAGVVFALLQRGHAVSGLSLALTGDVPQGSGLSSSAALEVAVGLAVQSLFGLTIPKATLAQIAQQAECEFAGVRCGIMDQFISCLANPGQALLIDCRSLAFRNVPLPLGEACVVVTNSNAPRELASSAYNQRRSECEAGVRALQAVRPGKALRDFGLRDLEAIGLDPIIRKRCAHVIAENDRVLCAEAALQAGDLGAFGRLMSESHESLRDLYEVTSRELDWLVERARETPGVFGSRMTGAGFGGCTVTLMEAQAQDAYRQAIAHYRDRFHLEAEVLVTQPGPGSHLLSDF